MRSLFLSLPLAVLGATPALASEVFRCATGGSVAYQEFPCGSASGETRLELPRVFPEVNAAARSQLLEREAALDRRLEAERERLSREEIARIAARAQVAAAAAATPVEPVYLAAWPAYRPAWRARAPAHHPALRTMNPANPANPWNPR